MTKHTTILPIEYRRTEARRGDRRPPRAIAGRQQPEGHELLLASLRQHRVKRVGIEASGGYEQPVVIELRRKRFVVVMFQPTQVRGYAKFQLQRAKNEDKIDAALIASCTAAVRKIHAAPDPRLLPFAERLTMIDQIGEDIARLKNRIESCRNAMIKKLWQEEHRPPGEAREGRVHGEFLVVLIRKHRDLASRLRRLHPQRRRHRLPTAVAILVRLPEIGEITRERARSRRSCALRRRQRRAGRCSTYRGRAKAAAPRPLHCRTGCIVSLEPTAHRALPKADRGRKGTQARACCLREEDAHLRQHRGGGERRGAMNRQRPTRRSREHRRFLSSAGTTFLGPTCDPMTPRAATVKDGRRSPCASYDAVARPRLDGREHGVIVRGGRS